MPGSADRWASHILAVRSCARRKTPLGMWTTQHSSIFLNGYDSYDPRFAISNQKILESWNILASAELGSKISRDDSSGHTEFWSIDHAEKFWRKPIETFRMWNCTSFWTSKWCLPTLNYPKQTTRDRIILLSKYLLKPGKRGKPVLRGRQKAFAVGRIGHLGEEGGAQKALLAMPKRWKVKSNPNRFAK